MGSPEDEQGRGSSEGPQRQVAVPEFWLARAPVTNEEYGRFLAENSEQAAPEYWTNERFNQPQQPVVGVSAVESRH